jgi:molybdopterin-guanine dinucleotide biosynthesis protein A
MTISAVLLAGGESRRMGKDKATIEFNDQPLWQRQLNLLRKLKPAEIFVSARTDPVWRPNECKFLADEPPSLGPMSGIASTLGRIQSTHLLVLAIDMPFMNEPYLRSLCDLVARGRGVVPKIDDRFEPLAAIYPKNALDDFQHALSSDDFSLQTLTTRLIESGKLRVVAVAGEARDFFRNLNEPSDLEDEKMDGSRGRIRRCLPLYLAAVKQLTSQ